MTLTDPTEALAEQSSFVDYLVGLAGLAEVVRTLAEDDGRRIQNSCATDDFVFLLLGLASVGEAIERLAEPAPAPHQPAPSAYGRWLR